MYKVQWCPEIKLFQVTLNGDFIGLRNLESVMKIAGRVSQPVVGWEWIIAHPDHIFTI